MSILFAPASLKTVRGTAWQDNIFISDLSTGLAVNLTGIVGITMRIRKSINATAVLMELSIANGRLVVVAPLTGEIGVRVSSATSNSSFPANSQRRAKYVYDALIERTTGEYEPAISGKVTVKPSVTRVLDP